jgi:hypothetical protein
VFSRARIWRGCDAHEYSLSTDNNAIRSVLHHHPDHLVHDPAPTPGGEDDFTHEEVLLKGLFAGRSGGLDVTLGHGSSCVEWFLIKVMSCKD